MTLNEIDLDPSWSLVYSRHTHRVADLQIGYSSYGIVRSQVEDRLWHQVYEQVEMGVYSSLVNPP
jgi:hypothetical protein